MLHGKNEREEREWDGIIITSKNIKNYDRTFHGSTLNYYT